MDKTMQCNDPSVCLNMSVRCLIVDCAFCCIFQIPVSTWMMLELFTLVVWLIIMNTSKSFQAFLYLIIGYSLPLTLRAVHGKTMHIKGDATISGGHLESMLDEHKKALGVPNRVREMTPLLDAEKESGEGGDPPQGTYGGVANQNSEPSTPAQHKILPDDATNSTLRRRSSQPAKAFASFHTPRRYDPASLVAHYGISGHDAKEHHRRFWFGERYKVSLFFPIIVLSLVISAHSPSLQSCPLSWARGISCTALSVPVYSLMPFTSPFLF